MGWPTRRLRTNWRHNSTADICKKAVDCEFFNTGGISAEFFGWTAKTTNMGTAIRQISYSTFIFGVEIRFKNQVTTCSVLPSDAMLWIKEVEMVDSLDELESSRSVYGKDFSRTLRCWTRRQFKKKDSFEKQNAQKEDRFLRGRQIAFMIYDHFRVTGDHDTVLDHADLFSVTLHDDNIQEFDTRWDEVPLSMSKIPSDEILESLHQLRIRESDQLKTALELNDMEIHQKISVSQNQKLKTMVKRP